MKKFIIIFLIVIGVQSLSAQYSTMFNDTLQPFGSGAYSIDNIQKDNSYYYATGIFAGNKTNNKQQLIILKIDYNGILINKKLLIDSLNSYSSYYYNSLIINENKLIQLNIKTDTQNRDLGAILVLNKNTLDTLWTKTYSHPDTVIAQSASDVFSVLTAIKATPDGGYILTGNYNKNCITGNVRSFLMKIDSVGNVEWRKTYDDVTYLFDIEFTSNGGYAFLNKFGNNVNKIVFTDSVGIIKSQQLINSGLGGLSKTSSIANAGGNKYIGVHTFTFDTINHYYGLNVYKYDYSTNQVLWDKKFILYDKIGFISLHPALGVEVLSDGSIIASATAKRYGYDAVILKLNSNGDSLWCKSYDFEPDPWDCQLNDLIVTNDGGFMGVGFWSDQSGPGWTAWMFKTDANGYVGINTSTPLSVRDIVVYPNPASEKLIIEITDNKSQTALLEIYNSEGKRIMNTEHRIRNVEVNVSSWSAGVYFGRIIFETGESKGFKFVVE